MGKVEDWGYSDIGSFRSSTATCESIDMQYHDSYNVDNDSVFSDNEELITKAKIPREATPYRALYKNNSPLYTFSFAP